MVWFIHDFHLCFYVEILLRGKGQEKVVKKKKEKRKRNQMPLEREDQVESNDLNLNQLCFWILNHFDAMLYDWRCANLVHFIFLSFLPSFLPSFLRSLTPSSSQVVCHLLCFFMTLLSLPFFLLSHSCSFRAIPQSILSSLQLKKNPVIGMKAETKQCMKSEILDLESPRNFFHSWIIVERMILSFFFFFVSFLLSFFPSSLEFSLWMSHALAFLQFAA